MEAAQASQSQELQLDPQKQRPVRGRGVRKKGSTSPLAEVDSEGGEQGSSCMKGHMQREPEGEGEDVSLNGEGLAPWDMDSHGEEDDATTLQSGEESKKRSSISSKDSSAPSSSCTGETNGMALRVIGGLGVF